MSRRNQQDEAVATIATLAAGAAVGYGCYKAFKSIFGSNNTTNQQSQSAGPSFGSMLQTAATQRSQTQSATPSFGSMLQTAAVGYQLYQSAQTSDESYSNRDDETPPQTIKFRMHSPYSFPKETKIYVVNTVEECRYAMKELKSHCDEYNVLGFDCEWVNKYEGGRQKVALLQLASYRGLCVLVRLYKLHDIPLELKNILKDSNIIKVGISSLNDAKFLFQDYFDQGHVASTLDLRYVANIAQCYDEKNIGLAKMAARYLNVILNKDFNVRCSDWNAFTLSDEQIQYAANDAIIAIELFKYFAEKIEPSGMFRSNSSRLEIILGKCSTLFDKDYHEDWEI